MRLAASKKIEHISDLKRNGVLKLVVNMRTLGTVIKEHFENNSPVGKYKTMEVCKKILEIKNLENVLSEPDIKSLDELMKDWEKWLAQYD